MARKPDNLYLRGKTWWGRVKIAGVEHRSSLRTEIRGEATRRLKAWRTKLERDAIGDPEAPTFMEAALKWDREVLEGSVKPSVQARYASSISQLAPIFGTLRMDQIGPKKIAEYVSSRAGQVSNATIRRDLTALSRLLAACVSWGWRTDNPARDYDRSMVTERRDPIELPGDREWGLLLAEAPEEMAKALRLLDQSGFRLQEGLDLTGDRVDKARAQVTLTFTKTGRRRVVDWRTPGGDMTPLLADAPKSGRLFKDYANFSSNVGQVMRRIEKAEREAGRSFRRFRVHDLRHRFAVRWLKHGGNIYPLSRHLGHTSVKTTEIYLDHLTEAERQVAQKGAQQAEEVR